jgi:uncharacterized protein
MAEVEAEIDSIRLAGISPECVILLARKRGPRCFLPVWVSFCQADILASQLQEQSDKSSAVDLFLADIDAVDSDIGGVTIHLENSIVYAKVLLLNAGRSSEVRCPIGIALAIAVRSEAPILIEETLFDKAGVCLPWTRCETPRKASLWRRLLMRQN